MHVQILVGSQKEIGHVRNLGIDGKLILKCMLNI
jgi:hypothetical protein